MQLKYILKSLLKDADISISQLSKRTEVPVQTLHNWLNGIEPRSIRQVKKVSEFFEVSLDYLCFGVSKESQTPGLNDFKEEINAGVYEVVLRRVRK